MNTEIEIDGKKYKVNVEQAVRDGYLTPSSPIQVGQQFQGKDDGDYYVLADFGYRCICLININSGERWRDAVQVENTRDVSNEEWRRITGSAAFERIKHYSHQTEKE